ncbi:tissue factor pathway inhibitor-like [Spodoptera litura]|uniref:Tissue factor pathway inhibitor-like n=1 Tax=Spodoptera litura TaxID=69820 RepID=A0A9J7IIX6_SPOLT|nr:tissue factor pathway inhibitor-like [Spodoptera litura]
MSVIKMSSWIVLFVILFIVGSECKKKKVSSGHKPKLNICTLEIDEGDCGGDSMSEEPENSTIYYGFNNETMKCEEFVYEGCGGNDNRFDSINECWRMCYTPLKYFLARVTDYLMHQYNTHPPETSTSSSNSEQKD